MPYKIVMEISGPSAMWTRPDTGDMAVSYPAPTASAVKGIFESILWLPNARVVPKSVEICAPITHHTYATNYGGPLRKARQKSSGSSYQLNVSVLINVCYRFHAEAVSMQHPPRVARMTSPAALGCSNPAHSYQEIFERRLRRGQCYTIPSLGWKEFVPDYVGPVRKGTRACEDISMSLPSFLLHSFTQDGSARWEPRFMQNAEIVRGVLKYAQ